MTRSSFGRRHILYGVKREDSNIRFASCTLILVIISTQRMGRIIHNKDTSQFFLYQ